MLPIFIYILKTILVSGILLGYYWISLRNTKFHYYNRFYLGATVALSLILPLLDLQWFTFSAPETLPVQQVVQYIYQPKTSSPVSVALGWEQILTILLFSVSVILVGFFIYGIWKVFLIKAKGKITMMERFNFIETAMDEAPFSFFRNLFWRQDLPVHDATGQRMLKHELTHIEQHHSYDKLFVAFTTYVFWMNPFYWLIRKELEVVHEFIADEQAVAGEDAGLLAEMLLKAHYHSNILSVGQSFFYSSIKRRIIMLTSSKKVSYSYARRLLILPVAVGVLALLSFTIKDSLSNSSANHSSQNAPGVSQLDTIPSKYLDPKTGKIKGSFQIDIDGDMASFKDIKSKKELFKVPLQELAGPAKKLITVQGFPLDMSKNVMFFSGDSSSKAEFIFISDSSRSYSMSPMPPFLTLPDVVPGQKSVPTIVINGKVVTPEEIAKMEHSSIKTIDIRGNEEGIAIAGQKMTGVTRTESTSTDGKKIVTIRVDSVITQGKGATMPAHVKVIAGATAPQTIVVTTTDTSIASAAVKDPRTLTVTVTGSDGDMKKTYTIIQKQTEKTELPKDVLYIIDGKEMPSGSMKDIDPTSIKSINVLKGESATKKYGEKGKNGVIEIIRKN